jgi:4-amino-4-deoxy-L-arabinose transferase-like glycosyltransferase
MNTSSPVPAQRFDASTLAWLALLALAVAVYALGLGGQYIPSNGDELVYSHIARLTAASKQWLPLVSELDHMRNTKPPLLFWQGMLASDWGQHWSQAALRAPSLLYTLLTTGAILWSVQKITGNLRSACIAACVYLTFFCTFRFGRTYLTSAPETFWLSLPMFWLLWARLDGCRVKPGMTAGDACVCMTGDRMTNGDLSWLAHAGFGLALGLGLAYKSFALIAPAAAALWCAQLLSAPVLNWRTARSISLKVALSSALALAIFALWFVLDPDPAAVWQEFVIGENAGKLSSGRGYWQVALFGGGVSIWAQLLAYVQNAGLLALVVLGLIGLGLRTLFDKTSKGKPHSAHMIILLSWLAVWLIVFSLPSQRSARYVIPAMPALAILIALYWQRIGRTWFVLSLLLCGLLIAALSRIAWAAHGLGIASNMELGLTLLVGLAGLLLLGGGLFKPAWTRACTVAMCLLVYASFGFSTAGLNGIAGQYASTAQAKLQGARVAVPNAFNGEFERFQFLLPGNRFVPYATEERSASNSGARQLAALLSSHDAVIWLQSDLSELAPPCAPDCRVLGWRWEVKGRHRSGEINTGNVWYPDRWLFRREWLVTSALPSSGGAPG